MSTSKHALLPTPRLILPRQITENSGEPQEKSPEFFSRGYNEKRDAPRGASLFYPRTFSG